MHAHDWTTADHIRHLAAINPAAAAEVAQHAFPRLDVLSLPARDITRAATEDLIAALSRVGLGCEDDGRWLVLFALTDVQEAA